MLNRLASRFFEWTHHLAPESDEMTRLSINIGLFASFMGIFFTTVLGFAFSAVEETWAGIVCFGFGIWLLVVILLFVRKQISIKSLVYFNLACLMITNFIANSLLGGTQSAVALILWSSFGPLLISVAVNPRQMGYWGLAWAISLMTSLFLPDLLGQTSSLPLGMVKVLFFFNVGGVGIVALLIVQYFVTQRNLYQERSDALLLNILPPEVADILRQENRIIADSFDCASVLFADVVGFTAISANLSPVELVELLNEIFSYFDSLVEKYGLEKIKTIGDCYMAAGGIPRPRPDHARATVLMGLEILDFAQTHPFQGQKLAFRIGINSGPVVAGVIGQKKFAYDLWGDAVNIARRMESQGVGNRIQITRDTYQLIKDDFICLPQAPLYVKGKGEMEIWHVIRAVE